MCLRYEVLSDENTKQLHCLLNDFYIPFIKESFHKSSVRLYLQLANKCFSFKNMLERGLAGW